MNHSDANKPVGFVNMLLRSNSMNNPLLLSGLGVGCAVSGPKQAQIPQKHPSVWQTSTSD